MALPGTVLLAEISGSQNHGRNVAQHQQCVLVSIIQPLSRLTIGSSFSLSYATATSRCRTLFNSSQ